MNSSPKWALFCFGLLAAMPALSAADLGVSLNSDAASPAAVANTIHWTAAADRAGDAALEYQFSVAPVDGATRILRSYHPANSFEYTPMIEGAYTVTVNVRDASGNTGMATDTVAVTSRITDPDTPVVSRTANPLIALYSAPPCSAGSVRVILHPAANLAKQYSPYKKCVAGKSLNFLVPGMLANVPYVLQQEQEIPNQASQFGPEIPFRSGDIPALANLPAAVVLNARDSATDASQSVLLTSYIAALPGQSSTPVATDMRGRVIWYYGPTDKPLRYLLRPLAGGTMLVSPADASILREIDLAGNTVRETNSAWISEQLRNKFGMQPITSFHHDAIRLPNGLIAAIASVERIFNGIQGSSGPVDVLGDAIVVMDQDFNVTWAWNSFDHLDVTRGALLGETCASNGPGCPPVLLAPSIQQTSANDWLHSNSLSYLADGNLLLSLRHQDWVVKIDYADGNGTGGLLWTLGNEGNFTLNSSEASPWFSHQHSVVMSGDTVWLFDNGNTRHNTDASAKSRGQVLRLDETAGTAEFILNADLEGYSPALGSAERLENGNYHFLSGDLGTTRSQSIEVVAKPTPAGALDYRVEAPNPAYRSFRMKNLSTP